MQITSIKSQVKRSGRYSIFVDGKYAFSLSDTALLDSRLVTGRELTEMELEEFKQASIDDKLYGNTLGYLAIRSRTVWEVETYLRRKAASPTLIKTILNKLSKAELLDDKKFAVAFINDRHLLRPTSRRKITMELRKKHVEDAVIQSVLGDDEEPQATEQTALQAIIERKRRQAKYRDDPLKLMQYLARQGFNYGDIKTALQETSD